jgi:hypothetical protein
VSESGRCLAELGPEARALVDERIRTLAGQGKNDRQIGAELGLRTSSVAYARNRIGIPPAEKRWLRRERPTKASEPEAPVAPLEVGLARARLMEAITLGQVRQTGAGITRRTRDSNFRVDRDVQRLQAVGWATVGSDGVVRLTGDGDAALAAYRAERDARHGLVVSRYVPRARPDGR